MRWPWRRPESDPVDEVVEERAERIVDTGAVVDSETAGLDQVEVVRGWLRRLAPDRAEQVFVHRSWGTVGAVVGGRHPVALILGDGGHTWFAVPLESVSDEEPLAPGQVEQAMVEALTASERASWLRWVPLV